MITKSVTGKTIVAIPFEDCENCQNEREVYDLAARQIKGAGYDMESINVWMYYDMFLRLICFEIENKVLH